MHPEHTDATANDIDRYLYNNVKEYHESKRTYYREKYRTKKNNEVRKYIKYLNTTCLLMLVQLLLNKSGSVKNLNENQKK